ncbi:dTDP-4-dehydrorhamnose 3,5-epimerase [Planktothrix sp. FACHB-1355]|uniref:dTDP-4-dehydrorhamnose 3,5-epimerase n=1 Tax=Aerosakkonema funiforme FACHB-1375 TaxID=2949571 RepID=A0A926VBQ3_9CYAN|nr:MULTISPECIES: dTDP-4-dehydrorhamnose 3,5-epimerase [Oscillatoriales]MBD2180887.1 dTDP-4-dehydrorhamnose 3,5-epimerase [Aerosakkonema funiforme FACHB-1375]MBD3562988.1 dTDP-4-dehydrorhamnose 3,5-epimerase [Planktothrix sp. FACHB-1355]
MTLRTIQIRPLSSVKAGMTEFYTPQSSDETMLVQIPPCTIEEMFVHRFQTDQLFVVRGTFVLVTLENRRYQYTLMSDCQPKVVTIPVGVLHGAINLSDEPCLLVNAVLRHGPPHERDYRPVKPPFPYNLGVAEALLKEFRCSVKV